MQFRQLASATLLAATLLAAGAAGAAPVRVTGHWSFSVDGDGFSNETFRGSASFMYDDAFVTGKGVEGIEAIPLLSFTQSPALIGSTVFDISNTSAVVGYLDGKLLAIAVGGNTTGVAAVRGNTDDFYVFERDASVDVAAIAKAGQTHLGHVFDVNVAFTAVRIAAVPEPSILALLGVALVGAAGAGRRRTDNR